MFQEKTGDLSFRHVKFEGNQASDQSGSVGGLELIREMAIGYTYLVMICRVMVNQKDTCSKKWAEDRIRA